MKRGFSSLALVTALGLFAASFAAQLALRTWLGAHTLLSSDAVMAASFGAEALLLLLSGFAVTFLGRGAAAAEQGVASLLLGVLSFFVLRKVKPPSFGYDHVFATDLELLLLAAITSASSLLLGLWGSSFGLLIGAGRDTDLSLSFEAGVARTHLKLTPKAALRVLWTGASIGGGFYGGGVLGSWLQGTRDQLASQWALAALGLGSLFALLAVHLRRWLRERRLLPGQKRKRPATEVMTSISIAGVAVGVTALTVVLSVMGGFEADLKKKIIGTTAYGVLLKHIGEFSEWQRVGPEIAKVPGVTGVSPFILNEVMIAHKDALTGSEIKGIDPASAGQVSDLPKQVIAGNLDWLTDPSRIPVGKFVDLRPGLTADQVGADLDQYLEDTAVRRKNHPEESGSRGIDPEALAKMPGICIGKEMSHQLRIWVGDAVSVITPLGEAGPTGIQPRGRTFRVACILYSGMFEYDMKYAYIAIADAQSFFRLKDTITGFELKFQTPDEARASGRRVVAALKGFPYRYKDWTDLNRNLFSALKLEKLAMGVILTFILLVASFNIFSTLFMLVLEKTKEISILKSMGARDASVMKIFVIEGASIGALGTAIGLFVGLCVCTFVSNVALQLDPDVYYISRLPVTIDPSQFAIVACIALCLTYLSTLYPAIKASHLPPVDGLREE
jgi:lipoprotein-releasing system permease protein